MSTSKDGKTIGITLRVEKVVFQAYASIATRANLIEIRNGKLGGYTAQDIMRHRLASLPILKKLMTQKDTNEN